VERADQFETLKISKPANHVMQVELNRPEKRNAMNGTFWKEFKDCIYKIGSNPEIRVVILAGAGPLFTSGLDVKDQASLVARDSSQDVARRAFELQNTIREFQSAFTALELIPQPVIAAIHSACLGAGVDMISACDIRYCSADAWFSIKEVDLGLAADVGTLQRFPKITGNDSWVRELAYTARKFDAKEALTYGLVNKVLPTREALMSDVLKLAIDIAAKSPVAVVGTKRVLNYSRDRSVQDGLDFVAYWNMAMLQSQDIPESFLASMSRPSKLPLYSNL